MSFKTLLTRKAITSLTGFTIGDILTQKFVNASDQMRTLHFGSLGSLQASYFLQCLEMKVSVELVGGTNGKVLGYMGGETMSVALTMPEITVFFVSACYSIAQSRELIIQLVKRNVI